MKFLLVLTLQICTISSFAKNLCVDIFVASPTVASFVEDKILMRLDALVVEKLKIDNKKFANENQYRQAVEYFKKDLNEVGVVPI
jgi:hypothetical protein